MKNNSLIKVNDKSSIENLYSNILKNKYFLIKDSNNYFISKGNFYSSKISNDQIKKIFFNKLNLSNQSVKKNFELFSSYNYVSIIYWVSCPINF